MSMARLESSASLIRKPAAPAGTKLGVRRVQPDVGCQLVAGLTFAWPMADSTLEWGGSLRKRPGQRFNISKITLSTAL